MANNIKLLHEAFDALTRADKVKAEELFSKFVESTSKDIIRESIMNEDEGKTGGFSFSIEGSQIDESEGEDFANDVGTSKDEVEAEMIGEDNGLFDNDEVDNELGDDVGGIEEYTPDEDAGEVVDGEVEAESLESSVADVASKVEELGDKFDNFSDELEELLASMNDEGNFEIGEEEVEEPKDEDTDAESEEGSEELEDEKSEPVTESVEMKKVPVPSNKAVATKSPEMGKKQVVKVDTKLAANIKDAGTPTTTKPKVDTKNYSNKVDKLVSVSVKK